MRTAQDAGEQSVLVSGFNSRVQTVAVEVGDTAKR